MATLTDTHAVPTRRMWAVLAVGIPICWIMGSLGAPWFFFIYNGLVALFSWATYRLAPTTEGLQFSRRMDAVLSVRVWNKVQLMIENDGDEPIDCVLRDEPPTHFEVGMNEWRIRLAPGERREVNYSIRPPIRGEAFFAGTYLRVKCPFGLLVKQGRVPNDQAVRVFPNVLALREFDLLKQQGRLRDLGIRKARNRGLGSEFESIRDYAEGDDFRKIDWKATARRQKLMVRNYETERNQSVILAVDCGRHMMAEVEGVRKLDHVLDAILMLGHAASAAGDNVGLLAYSNDIIRFLPPRKGRAQIGIIIDALHNLRAEPIESDIVRAFGYLNSRYKRRSLLIVFTANEDPERADEIVTALSPLARQHITLVATVGDPKIKALLSAPVSTLDDLNGMAAAHWVTREKQAASGRLAGFGLHRLESEPQDLAADLVNYYLDVKARCLL